MPRRLDPVMIGRQTVQMQPGQVNQTWRVVDATDQPLGRLAAEVATVLMGKHRPEYTPHVDTGDWVIVLNGSKVGLSGCKAERRFHQWYTEHPNGRKLESFGSLRERRPEKLIENAVRRMLPKNRLGRVMLSHLKVYPAGEHPHQAQQPVAMEL